LAEDLKPKEPFRPSKVLLVDDESLNRNFVATILKREKFEYFEAING